MVLVVVTANILKNVLYANKEPQCAVVNSAGAKTVMDRVAEIVQAMLPGR